VGATNCELPALTDGASCLIESSCPVIISFAEIS